MDALRREAILGAALDVTAVEPLPEGHPFYALKNCLMSFHCADLTEDYFELSAGLREAREGARRRRDGYRGGVERRG